MTAPTGHRMPMSVRAKIALLITAVTLVPALVMVGVAYLGTGQVQAAATWASIPAIAGIAAVAVGGRRYAVITSIVMGFMAPLAIVAGLSPVSGAALMALMCLMVGRLARIGFHRSAMFVPLMMAWPLIDPPTWSGQALDRLDTAYLLWMALIFLVGGLIPALVGPLLLRKRSLPKPQPHSQHEAVVYTVMITVLVTLSTFYVLANPKMYGGAFLIAAILVLAPIGTPQTLRPTIIRVVSTVVGSVLVIGVVSYVNSLGVIYLIGLVMIVIALVAKLSGWGWLYYVLMVPATAALNATTLTQVGQLSTQRVVDNIVGGVLVLAASVVTMAYAHWAAKHGHAQDEDIEVTNLTGAAAAPSAATA